MDTSAALMALVASAVALNLSIRYLNRLRLTKAEAVDDRTTAVLDN